LSSEAVEVWVALPPREEVAVRRGQFLPSASCA
jgi:hypothetical protein